MDNKNSNRGFSGLTNLVTDIRLFHTQPRQPNSHPSAPQNPVFPLLELTKWPTLPAPWSSVDKGETWIWGDFFLTFQKKPKSVLDVAMEMQGKQAENQAMTYHYAMSVFYRIDRNPHGPSHRPIMTIALEQADMGMLTKMFDSETRELLQAQAGSTMGPLMIGLFSGETRSNLGAYEGEISAQAVKQKFFEILGRQLGVSGSPKMIGDMKQAYGHPETGLPAKNPSNETTGSSKRNSTGGKWILGFIGIVAVIWLISNTGQSNKQPSQTPPASSQTYNNPESTAAPIVQTPSMPNTHGLQYTKPSVGTNHTLSVSEIQWCIRSGIRIETMRGIINTNAGIDAFNRIVNDHNSRCGSYRYRRGAQEKAKRNVEPYRKQIVEEAIREAKQLGRTKRP